MLSTGKIAAGPKAARYYTEQVAQGRDDYYSGEGEEPGKWVGSAAASLGLSGEVDDERFANLLAGAGLRKPPREGAIAGFDLTFRAPKSVSLLWGVGSPELTAQLRAGHDQAVSEGLGYLEREACRARRGAGGVLQVRAAGSSRRRSFIARRAPAIHCCTPTSSSATSRKARTGAGRRSTRAICIAMQRRRATCIRRCCGAS
jgi:hypothetical protein